MIISLRWVAEFIDAEWQQLGEPAKIADLLTAAGLEVESVSDLSSRYRSVVTGLVLKKEPHPQADRLSLCQVTTKEGIVHQIVCGAQNFKENDRVVVALPGAELPGGLAIKTSVVRGIESQGMLCSRKELGLVENTDGLWILPKETPLGLPLAELLEFNDVTFELKVTPNRADCLSQFGLARELAVLLGKKLKASAPTLQLQQSAELVGGVHVTVQGESARRACPRYAGLVIRGVRVGASPDWLRNRLEKVGLRSINAIVDATNYIMIERGQPLHAFDLGKIAGPKVVVRMAQAGEKLKTLDGTELELSEQDLVIANEKHPMVLAGVIGGLDSGVSEGTTDIFLEAAYFNPSFVRKSSRRYGISTDSSYRFSRGVDPSATHQALLLAAQLIVQLAGGEVSAQFVDSKTDGLLAERAISIRLSLVSERLGYTVTEQEFLTNLQRLGCSVEKTAEDLFVVGPPAYRFDLERDVDLIEEQARLKGFEHIPETLPVLHFAPKPNDPLFDLTKVLGSRLRGIGYDEAKSFFFHEGPGVLQGFYGSSYLATHPMIPLKNPLSEELSHLRVSLAWPLWKLFLAHHRNQLRTGRFFEIGTVAQLDKSGFVEQTHMGLVAWGQPVSPWQNALASVPLVLQVTEQLVAELAYSRGIPMSDIEIVSSPVIGEFVHPGRTAQFFHKGEWLGFVGELHPRLLLAEKVTESVVIGEIRLVPTGAAKALRVDALSHFPKVERDLALVTPTSLSCREITTTIAAAQVADLVSVQFFDYFRSAKLGEGKQSLALRLTFQSTRSTLTDEQVQGGVQKILDTLQQKWGISTR